MGCTPRMYWLTLKKVQAAVQAIFAFVSSWNNYFIPALVLDTADKKTLPILIAQLRSADFLKFDMGKVYMMVAIAILPVIIVYLLLSKFIARGRCFRFPHESPKRAFAISQDKRFVQHEPHLPVIGNAARMNTNELRPFLILLPYHNSRQPGDDLLRAVCCFFRFTKLN